MERVNLQQFQGDLFMILTFVLVLIFLFLIVPLAIYYIKRKFDIVEKLADKIEHDTYDDTINKYKGISTSKETTETIKKIIINFINNIFKK